MCALSYFNNWRTNKSRQRPGLYSRVQSSFSSNSRRNKTRIRRMESNHQLPRKSITHIRDVHRRLGARTLSRRSSFSKQKHTADNKFVTPPSFASFYYSLIRYSPFFAPLLHGSSLHVRNVRFFTLDGQMLLILATVCRVFLPVLSFVAS